MKTHLAVLMTLVASLSDCAIAQPEDKNHIILGITIPIVGSRTTGTTRGPQTVIDMILPGGGAQNFDDRFHSLAIFRLSAGVRVDALRTSVLASLSVAQVAVGDLGSGSEIEFSGRYLFWENGILSLSGIVSAKSGSYHRSSEMHGAYSFGKRYWLPGGGLGANVNIIHVEVLLYGWPGGTIVAYGAEPNGVSPYPYTGPWYTMKPIYLRYAVSFNVGIEFAVLSF